MAIKSTFVVPKSNTGIYTIPIGAGGSGGTAISDINKTPPAWIDDNILNHFIKDHAIQGQTVMFEVRTPMEQFDRPLTEKDIKERLVRGLVDEIVKTKCIEFTQMARRDINEMVFRARVHVVPDTQVRIIRELKDARKTP